MNLGGQEYKWEIMTWAGLGSSGWDGVHNLKVNKIYSWGSPRASNIIVVLSNTPTMINHSNFIFKILNLGHKY